jgi:hypothetical protein
MTRGVEALLREALAPVEPPPVLARRLESRLVNLTELAHDELEGWELSAMRDPRNWVRPVAAVVITATAGTALVALRVRRKHRARVNESRGLRQLTRRTLRDIAEETRRILPER